MSIILKYSYLTKKWTTKLFQIFRISIMTLFLNRSLLGDTLLYKCAEMSVPGKLASRIGYLHPLCLFVPPLGAKNHFHPVENCWFSVSHINVYGIFMSYFMLCIPVPRAYWIQSSWTITFSKIPPFFRLRWIIGITTKVLQILNEVISVGSRFNKN